MALKWVAIVVAAVSATVFVTVNVLVSTLTEHEVPILVNLVLIATTALTAALAVIGELYVRINSRLTMLTEFLIARLNELDTHTGDRNAGFVEGYLLSHNQDASVVPIGSRARGWRVMTGGEE